MDLTTFLEGVGSCLHGIGLSRGLYVSLFSAGLVGGFTHCASMCGPFVLSQTGSVSKISDSFLIPYHLGRITTYTAMAVVLSGLLNTAFLFLPIRAFVVAPILMLAGVIFLVTAFPALAQIFPWAGRLAMSVPYQWLHKAVQKLSHEGTHLKRYGMGVLLGFMPCGMIVSALMAASTAPTAWESGIAMVSFGAGTMPGLVSVALGGYAINQRFPLAMARIKKGMMVWSAIWLFAMAGFMLV